MLLLVFNTSASEVVREALRMMEPQNQLRAAKLEQLRQKTSAKGWKAARLRRGMPSKLNGKADRDEPQAPSASQEALMPVMIERPRAKSDLVEIWDYIAEDSEARADCFIDLIDQEI
jgi:Arc/MetJ-type ribon-helix-helix transcriptional regulator